MECELRFSFKGVLCHTNRVDNRIKEITKEALSADGERSLAGAVLY